MSTIEAGKNPRDIILKPVTTEKSLALMDLGKYTFEVDPRANKTEIKYAIEAVFPGVKVESVNTMRTIGKMKRQGYGRPGRRAAYKKATVTLTEDSKTIELFEGMV